MAIKWAIKSGNWSDPATWNENQLPQVDDAVYADGYTVTIDQDIAVASLHTTQRQGGTAGGGFTITNSRTLTLSGSGIVAGATVCLTLAAGNYNAVITGNVTAGSGSTACGIQNNSTGIVAVTGNVTGGSGGFAYGIWNMVTGTVAVTGNVTGGSGGYGIVNGSTGTIIVTGTKHRGTGTFAIQSTTNGLLIVTGDCYADPAPAIYWMGSGSLCVVDGNQYGRVEGSGQGNRAVVCYREAIPSAQNRIVRGAEGGEVPGTFSGNPAYFYGALASPQGHPDPADVRYGVTYGPNAEVTGTCRVPAAASVLYGVPVDATTGTAAMTESLLREIIQEELLGVTGGGGARTVAITVVANSLPLEGARVRVTRGAETYVQTTDQNGNVTFHLDDGTWQVAITAPLYRFDGDALVITKDTQQQYELAPVHVAPSEPGQVTAYTYCYDADGTAEKAVEVHLRMLSPPEATGAYDAEVRTAKSDDTGLVTFVGLFPGAKYHVWRGTRGGVGFTVPAGVQTVALPAIVG